MLTAINKVRNFKNRVRPGAAVHQSLTLVQLIIKFCKIYFKKDGHKNNLGQKIYVNSLTLTFANGTEFFSFCTERMDVGWTEKLNNSIARK